MTAPPPAAARVWLVDKPAGATSHDVVRDVRRALPGRPRVGHAGTLDPFATGLLVLLGGRATRLARYLTGLDKTYDARVRLGATSESGDPEGPITPTGGRARAEDLPGALAALTGPIRQQVPALSAVRVDGERLYRRTRRGERPELPVRDVTIHRLEILERGPDLAWIDLRLRCSSGTYVRSLASDLGERLGAGGYCERLRRTRVGDLDVAEAVAPEAVPGSPGIAPAAALAHLPRRQLTGAEAVDVAHGRAVGGAPATGPVALLLDERLVAVGRGSPDGRLRPEVVLT